jgi:type IV secretory pathway VirB3-like protein
MTPRRGTLSKINGALNKPTTKFGIDYRLLGACLFISVCVFLAGGHVAGVLLLPGLISAAFLLTKKEQQMFRLWLLSFRLGSHYDPGK